MDEHSFAPRSDWCAAFHRNRNEFRAIAPAAECFASLSDWPDVAHYADILSSVGLPCSAGGQPIRFVADRPVRRRRGRRGVVSIEKLYDGRIYHHGLVHTRTGSWHDFFNALVWASFPCTKVAINRRQYVELERTIPKGSLVLPGRRSPLQDTLAMLDEGGLILLCSPHVESLVRAATLRDDQDLLAQLVASRECRALIFGHAIFEHLVSDVQTLRPLALVLPTESSIDFRDDPVGNSLADRLLACVVDSMPDTVQTEEPSITWSPELFQNV